MRRISKRIYPRLPSSIANSWAKLSIVQVGIIVVTCFIAGTLYHLLLDTGLLANTEASRNIQSTFYDTFLHKISYKQLQRNFTENSAVIIDARLSKDYENGHLDSAINIPVDAGDENLRKTLERINRGTELIVYCQSKNCSFATQVAQRWCV